MKRSLLLFFMAFACICSPAKNDGEDNHLTVISYNIRNGEANDGTNSWKYRYPATILMLEDQAPDIFGLQEAYDYQVKFIKENLKGYKNVGIGREDGKSGGEHMSIFFNKKRISLLKWGTFWLSKTPDKPSKGWDAACKRTATWALMKSKDARQKFFYVNTHLDHVGREAQMKGLALIVEKIAMINPDNLPIVLTGDFNVTPDDPVLADLNTKMKSARATAEKTDSLPSFHGWGRSSEVIDHIYYSGFSNCILFKTIQDKYAEWNFISDHYPVKAILVF